MAHTTVLMPVYNAAATVRTAVESTLKALPPDSTLLVFDDKSTDDTLDVLDRISDRRLTIVEGEVNRGVSYALNALLDRADSEWIGRMDADDICLPWRFRSQSRALRAGADLVFGTVANFRGGPSTVRPIPPLPISTAAFPLHLVLYNPVAHSTMIARTSIIRDVGGYADVATEDYELWLRLAAAGHRVARVGAPVILYRVHPGQVTSTAAWKARPPLEPLVEASYRAMCRKVLGVEPTWFPNFRRNKQPPSAARAMVAAIERSSTHLGRVERGYLLHKARRAISEAVPTTDS